MRASKILLTLPAAILVLAAYTGSAQAQATRTWVSGVGDDANPCSRTAPCKTFAGAISKTAAGGEIDALDPGGFGAVTITKAITIDGGAGQVASVLVSGTNGINVAAGPNDVVILRNIDITGISGQGLSGVSFTAGAAVHIEHCNIFGFGTRGISMSTTAGSSTSGLNRLFVTDTRITNNATGVAITPTGGSAYASMLNVRADGNSGIGFQVDSGAALGAAMLLDHSASLINGTGVSNNGAKASILIGSTDIVGNGVGIATAGGAQTYSYQNNPINGNTTQYTGPAPTPLSLN